MADGIKLQVVNLLNMSHFFLSFLLIFWFLFCFEVVVLFCRFVCCFVVVFVFSIVLAQT